ncbi:MAG: hypothetical protein ACRD50_08705 [Candidatus Acidiferrales bacterium]
MDWLVKLGSLLALSVLAADSIATGAGPGGQQKDLTFKIEVPLEFKGRVISGTLRKSEVPELLELPVRNGNSDLKEGYGVEMTTPNHEKLMVYTCREWKKALSEGAYSATTFDMAMERFLIHTCGLLFELQNANLPTKSFIANPRVSLANLNLLPAGILLALPEDETPSERLRTMTVAEAVPKRNIERTTDEKLMLSYGGMQQSFREAARADFNGDGIEDILIFRGAVAEGGTMGYADYFVLTRTRPTGRLKLIETSEPLQKPDN